MTWYLKLPDDRKIDVESFDAWVYVKVEAETGKRWYEVTGNLYRELAGGLVLMREVLPGLGFEMPDPIPIGEYVKWFEWVAEDSLPTGGTDPTKELPSPLKAVEG